MPNAVFENGVAYERVRPNALQKLVFGDESSSMIDEVLEYRVRLGPQRDSVFIAPHTLVGLVKPKRAKAHLFVWLHYRNNTTVLQLSHDSRRARPYSPLVMNEWQHQRAFVVRFNAATDRDSEVFLGHVEHVASGQRRQFRSSEELVEFLAETLSKLKEESWRKVDVT